MKNDGVWVPAQLMKQDMPITKRILLAKIIQLAPDSETPCCPSNEYLEEFIGISQKQIQRYLKDFEKEGFIRRNIYRLPLDPNRWRREIFVLPKAYKLAQNRTDTDATSDANRTDISRKPSRHLTQTVPTFDANRCRVDVGIVKEVIVKDNSKGESVNARTHEEDFFEFESTPEVPVQIAEEKEKSSAKKEKDPVEAIREKVMQVSDQTKDTWKMKYRSDLTDLPRYSEEFAEWWISQQEGMSDSALNIMIKKTSAKVFQMKFARSWLMNLNKYSSQSTSTDDRYKGFEGFSLKPQRSYARSW